MMHYNNGTVSLKNLIPGQYYKAKKFEGYYIGAYNCLCHRIITSAGYNKALSVCTNYKMYGFYLTHPYESYHVIHEGTKFLHTPDVGPLTQDQIDYHYKLANNSDIINAQKGASIKKILKFVCEDSIGNLLVNDSDFIKWCTNSVSKFVLMSPDGRHIIILRVLYFTNMIFSRQHDFEIIGDMHYTAYNTVGKSRIINAASIQQLYPGYTAFKCKDSYAHISVLDNTGQIHRNLHVV